MTEVQSLLRIGDQVKPVDEWDLPEGWSEFQDALKLDGEAVTFDATKKRAAMVAGIIAERDRRMEIVVGQYSETEQKTWPMQIEEARAVLANPDDSALMIRPMAEARGQSVADFAAYIVQLNNAYRAATGAVFAASRRLMDSDPIPDDYKDNKHWP